jgi:excisionase family DNA binding protein
MSQSPEFYTPTQIASLLGISRVAVHKQIKSGKIKAQKVGRNYIVQAKDLPSILQPDLSEADKSKITQAVKMTIADYSTTLKLLGKE